MHRTITAIPQGNIVSGSMVEPPMPVCDVL
jgi:hypothetical protein